MKKYFIAALILVLGTLFIGQKLAVSQTEMHNGDGMLIHISCGPDDAHRVLMALQMARMMSADKKVLVYLDIEAVNIVLKNAKDIMHPAFPTAQTQIQYLLQHDVPIMACPGCLRAAGKTKADLMEGIQVAYKDAFYNFAEGKVITLDY